MLILTIKNIKITIRLHFFNYKIYKFTNGMNIFKQNSNINYKKKGFLLKIFFIYTKNIFNLDLLYR